jgi:serine/threonine protein kinase
VLPFAHIIIVHYHHVVHRDIKPENLLLTSDNHIKIADFGVSLLYEGENDRVQDTQGSAAFMAPEMTTAAEGKTGGFSGKMTDIWSAGVTLYVFIFGKLPFMAANVPLIYAAIAEDPLTFPAPLSPELNDLLTRMLDKNPSTRISIDDIKTHAWTTQNGTNPLVAFPMTLTSELKVSKHDLDVAVTLVSKVVLMVKIKGKMRRKRMQLAAAKHPKRPSLYLSTPPSTGTLGVEVSGPPSTLLLTASSAAAPDSHRHQLSVSMLFPSTLGTTNGNGGSSTPFLLMPSTSMSAASALTTDTETSPTTARIGEPELSLNKPADILDIAHDGIAPVPTSSSNNTLSRRRSSHGGSLVTSHSLHSTHLSHQLHLHGSNKRSSTMSTSASAFELTTTIGGGDTTVSLMVVPASPTMPAIPTSPTLLVLGTPSPSNLSHLSAIPSRPSTTASIPLYMPNATTDTNSSLSGLASSTTNINNNNNNNDNLVRLGGLSPTITLVT